VERSVLMARRCFRAKCISQGMGIFHKVTYNAVNALYRRPATFHTNYPLFFEVWTQSEALPPEYRIDTSCKNKIT
jgi:hypothetical protein